MDILSVAVMLFLIMDPLGNMPIFMSVLKHIEPKRRRVVLMREMLIALGIMLLFLFGGQTVLNFLHLDQEAVSLSGAIILFLIALRMIFPQPGGVAGLAAGEEPLIVPLAVPLVAGPSILAALILLANNHPHELGGLVLSLIGAWGVSSLILMFSGTFHRLLGERGLTAIERLMGMLLVMIAVQMFLDGLGSYFTA